jgi:hypothetical protein
MLLSQLIAFAGLVVDLGSAWVSHIRAIRRAGQARRAIFQA